MNAVHDVHGAALIFRRPLGVMLADDLRRVAQNDGAIVDGTVGNQDLRGERMAEAMGVGAFDAAGAKYGFERPGDGLNVVFAGAATAPEKVLAFLSRALRSGQTIERALDVTVHGSHIGAPFLSACRNMIALDAMLAQRGDIGNPVLVLWFMCRAAWHGKLR